MTISPFSACVFGGNRAIEFRKHLLIPAEVGGPKTIFGQNVTKHPSDGILQKGIFYWGTRFISRLSFAHSPERCFVVSGLRCIVFVGFKLLQNHSRSFWTALDLGMAG